MKISAISHQTNPHFGSENSRSNKLKNTAGAAVIALAAATAPMEEAKAQYYTPPIYPPTYYVPMPVQTFSSGTVPNCFIVGDVTKGRDEKSMRKVFDEIDANGNDNNLISAKEVVRTERKNWNNTSLVPYSNAQMEAAAQEFNTISKLYNEDDSDPFTMNYREYKAAMNDYMETKETRTFLDLWNLMAIPYLLNPPPRYHHHHRPVPPPRHDHRTPPPHRHW